MLESISKDVIRIAQEAGSYIKENFGKVALSDAHTKELNSLVSHVDKTAESICVEGLQALIPNSGFITEENTVDQDNKEWTWIIDPLDGTTNFLHGVPYFSVSIALKHKEEVQLGVVVDAYHNIVYHAIAGKGSYKGNVKLGLSYPLSLSGTLIVTGFPYSNVGLDVKLDVLKALMYKTQGVRRMGSAALDLCNVASGVFGAYYECHLNPWDIAAGALIVREAGGVVADLIGGDLYQDGKEILACHPDLCDEIISHTKSMSFL